MTRPPLEVADIVRAQGNRFIRTSCRWIHWSHRKVLLAIARCRTAALGGHRDQCPRCGYRALSFNSCRNRHCPKCQTGARDRWIACPAERTATPYLYPRRLHGPASSRPSGPGQQEGLLRSIVPRHGRDSARDRRRPQASRRTDRFLGRAAQLGSELVVPSAPALSDSSRWSFSRSHPLDPSPLSLLPTGRCTQSRLSRQIRRRS